MAALSDIHQKNQQSFTLIELLIVVAIIGILAAIIIVSLTSASARARDAQRIAQMKEIQNALSEYYIQNGSYPPCAVTWCVSQSGQNSWFQDALQPLVTQGFLTALPMPEYPNGGEYDYASPTTNVFPGDNYECGGQPLSAGGSNSYILSWVTETTENFPELGTNPSQCTPGQRCCIYEE